jgi:hypothetical protein
MDFPIAVLVFGSLALAPPIMSFLALHATILSSQRARKFTESAMQLAILPTGEMLARAAPLIESCTLELTSLHQRWRTIWHLSAALVLGAALVLLVGLHAIPHEERPALIAVFGPALALALIFGNVVRRRQAFAMGAWRRGVFCRLLPILAQSIDGLEWGCGIAPPSSAEPPWDELGISYDKKSFPMLITGTHAGRHFHVFEARLEREADDGSSVVFAGLAASFQTGTTYPGLLVAAERTSAVGEVLRSVLRVAPLQTAKCGTESIDRLFVFRVTGGGVLNQKTCSALAAALRLVSGTSERSISVVLTGAGGYIVIPQFALPGGEIAAADVKAHMASTMAPLSAVLAAMMLVRTELAERA